MNTYSTDLRERTVDSNELCRILADHGQLLGDYLIENDLESAADLPEYTDGNIIADWLGY